MSRYDKAGFNLYVTKKHFIKEIYFHSNFKGFSAKERKPAAALRSFDVMDIMSFSFHPSVTTRGSYFESLSSVIVMVTWTMKKETMR